MEAHGWLTKQGHMMPTWKKRYFVLVVSSLQILQALEARASHRPVPPFRPTPPTFAVPTHRFLARRAVSRTDEADGAATLLRGPTSITGAGH